MIERQARREFLGHFGQAFALFMSAYVAPPPTPDVANPPSRNASKDTQQQVGEPSYSSPPQGSSCVTSAILI